MALRPHKQRLAIIIFGNRNDVGRHNSNVMGWLQDLVVLKPALLASHTAIALEEVANLFGVVGMLDLHPNATPIGQPKEETCHWREVPL